MKGKVTFTVWLCGCNLRCPFCHNWRLAEEEEGTCKELDLGELLSALKESSRLVDYLHVTGGEPLLQAGELVRLFEEAKRLGVSVSLNSNLTLPSQLGKVLPYLDHVATDLKPPEFYGLSTQASRRLFQNFLASLEMLASGKIVVEVRVPVAKGYPVDLYRDLVSLIKQVKGLDYYFVPNRLLGPPLTQPRDEAWCELHCFKDREEDIGYIIQMLK